uniref:Uncharacterized protein n=1 Tax=Romanomermis culicivorax TaxID=13658 RepID=A0A915J1M1_ROMCU
MISTKNAEILECLKIRVNKSRMCRPVGRGFNLFISLQKHKSTKISRKEKNREEKKRREQKIKKKRKRKEKKRNKNKTEANRRKEKGNKATPMKAMKR